MGEVEGTNSKYTFHVDKDLTETTPRQENEDTPDFTGIEINPRSSHKRLVSIVLNKNLPEDKYVFGLKAHINGSKYISEEQLMSFFFEIDNEIKKELEEESYHTAHFYRAVELKEMSRNTRIFYGISTYGVSLLFIASLISTFIFFGNYPTLTIGTFSLGAFFGIISLGLLIIMIIIGKLTTTEMYNIVTKDRR